VASSGDNTLVAAVANRRIRVYNFVLVSAGAVAASFEDGAGGTELTGDMPLNDGTVVNPGFDPHGHFETSLGTLLNLELSGSVAVDGYLCYALIGDDVT
jgi:hypothetical protein